MYDAETNHKMIFARRLKNLRASKGVTQKEFLKSFSEYMDSKAISVSSLSSWELGLKTPHDFSILIALAEYFDVTVDYLIGRVDEESYESLPSVLRNGKIHEISPDELPQYNDKPVFLEFYSESYGSLWSIYDAKNDQFITQKGIIKNNSLMKYYISSQNYTNNEVASLTMDELLASTYAYIKYIGGDSVINSVYSGWYKVVAQKELVREGDGRVLPVTGLGITFIAYKR